MDPAAEQLSQLLLPSLSPLTLVVERGGAAPPGAAWVARWQCGALAGAAASLLAGGARLLASAGGRAPPCSVALLVARAVEAPPTTGAGAACRLAVVDLRDAAFAQPGGVGAAALLQALQPPALPPPPPSASAHAHALTTLLGGIAPAPASARSPSPSSSSSASASAAASAGALLSPSPVHLVIVDDVGALVERCESLAAARALLDKICAIGGTGPAGREGAGVAGAGAGVGAGGAPHAVRLVTLRCCADAEWALGAAEAPASAFASASAFTPAASCASVGLLESLAARAHTIVRVGPLASGFSREVHGRVAVDVRAHARKDPHAAAAGAGGAGGEGAASVPAGPPAAGAHHSPPPAPVFATVRSALFRLGQDGVPRAVGGVAIGGGGERSARAAGARASGRAASAAARAAAALAAADKEEAGAMLAAGEPLVDD